jgi:hypothetical protein
MEGALVWRCGDKAGEAGDAAFGVEPPPPPRAGKNPSSPKACGDCGSRSSTAGGQGDAAATPGQPGDALRSMAGRPVVISSL